MNEHVDRYHSKSWFTIHYLRKLRMSSEKASDKLLGGPEDVKSHGFLEKNIICFFFVPSEESTSFSPARSAMINFQKLLLSVRVSAEKCLILYMNQMLH